MASVVSHGAVQRDWLAIAVGFHPKLPDLHPARPLDSYHLRVLDARRLTRIPVANQLVSNGLLQLVIPEPVFPAFKQLS